MKGETKDDQEQNSDRSVKSRLERAHDNAEGWKVTTREAFTLYRKHALQLTLHQTAP